MSSAISSGPLMTEGQAPASSLFLSQARGGGHILSLQPSDPSCCVARAAPAEKLCRASETLSGTELCVEMWATSSQLQTLSQLQLQTMSQVHPKDQHLALGHGSSLLMEQGF